MLFGTMRVAGTVIWSTDLKETRGRSGGGKGQAATTTYSYAASFAVLLSARAIAGIGRIWADGRLVRGAAGDLKVKAVLRVHRGGEDQPVDPLIASVEGVAPAYRGMAYMVWEDVPLGEFGNRIPQLTVEVIAAAGPVAVGDIAAVVAPEVTLHVTPNVTGPGGATLDGFAVTGSVRGVLEVLAQAGQGWWAPVAGALALHRDAGAAVVLADAGVTAVGLRGAARARQVAAIEGVPRAVAVSHYDPARDWQAGVQRAERAGPGAGVERIEMPAAMDAGVARALATALLASAGAARVRRTVTLGFAGMAVAPGAVVRLAGEAGRWRVLDVAIEAMATRLVLAPLPPASAAPTSTADSGRVAAAADAVVGATLLRVAELPALDDVPLAVPRLVVLATGTGAGWRQATLLWSADDGVSWTPAGATAAPAVLGTVEAATPFATACLRDGAGAVVVRLARADMMLADADPAALDRGANLAIAGGELIQFGRAVPLGAGRWRLSQLLRGRRGTEAVPVVAGDGFALVREDEARAIDLPLAALGRTVRVMASGAGDAAPVEARAVLAGASLRPPAPVAGVRRGDGIGWTRRSRLGWGWRDGGDAPLGEEAERYRVTLVLPDGTATDRDVDAPWLAGPIAAGTRVAVRQRGTWAESLPLHITI